MGFQWRKTVAKGPLHVNLSKSGVGWSLGIPGIRFGVGADGVKYLSLGLPKTGLRYVKRFGKPNGGGKPGDPDQQ